MLSIASGFVNPLLWLQVSFLNLGLGKTVKNPKWAGEPVTFFYDVVQLFQALNER
jgi:hypothetical protein